MSAEVLKIRSLPVRLVHWTVVICITLNLFVLEEGDPPHRWLGYLAVTAILLRFFWAFLKKENLKNSASNKLAFFTYVLIWTMIFAMGVSGFLMETDRFFGEDWLEDIHENVSVVLQGLILLHFCGILLDAYKHRRPTWMKMIR